MNTIDTETVYDAVIVGGGLAGLTVAYQLRDKNILVLEKEDRFGGRARSEKIGKVTNNIGTQFFSDSDAPTIKMFNELGVTRTYPKPTKVPMALDVNGTYYADATKYFSPKVIGQFIKLVFRCYRKYRVFLLPMNDPRWQELVGGNAKDLHEGIGDELMDFMNLFLRGTCLSKPERTSAGMGAAFGASLDQGKIAIVDNGFDDVTNRLASHVAESVVHSAEVSKVVERNGIVEVAFLHDGKEYTVRAHDGVIAAPAPVVPSFMPELPQSKRNALEGVVYGSITMVSLILKKSVSWERFYALMSDTTIFQGAIDQTRGYAIDKDPNQPIVLNFIVAPYPDEREEIDKLLNMPHEELVAKVIADFKRVVPNVHNLEESLIDSVVTHYPVGEVELSPEYYELLPELEKSVGNIHFCGDYTHRLSFIDGTLWSAFRVARALGSSFVISDEKEKAYFNPPKYGVWGGVALLMTIILTVVGISTGGILGTVATIMGSVSTIGTLLWPNYMPPMKQFYQFGAAITLIGVAIIGVLARLLG